MCMKYQELWGPTGKRLYRLGEDGKEYLYFKSKKQKIIIRDFDVNDATAYYNAMVLPIHPLQAVQKRQFLDSLVKTIEARDSYEDSIFSLIVTDLISNVLGTIDVEPKGGDSYITINLRSKLKFDSAEERIINALKELQQEHYWCDNLYLCKDKEIELIGELF